MRAFTKLPILLTFLTLSILLIPNHEAFAEGKDKGDGLKLIRTIEDKKSLELPKPSKKDVVNPDATLPAPSGGSISWNVASRLNLYEDYWKNRSAGGVNTGNTSQPIDRLYLQEGRFYADGGLKQSIVDHNKSVTNQSKYTWSTNTTYGNAGVSFFEVFGTRHSAIVTAGGQLYTLNTSANTNW